MKNVHLLQTFLTIFVLKFWIIHVESTVNNRIMGSEYPNISVENETSSAPLLSLKDKICAKYRSSDNIPSYCRVNTKNNVTSETSVTNASDVTAEPNNNYFVRDRIINGYSVALKNHPWVVSIEIRRPDGITLICGGTIIADDTILTAGHCVFGECEGTVYSSDIRKFEGWEYYFKCRSEQVLIRSGSDMALIKVNDKIYGVPISMPQGPEEAPKAGDKVFVLGWGRMCNERGILCSKQERKAEVLQGVTINVARYCYTGPGTFCGGGYDEHGWPRDACIGDSGTTVECRDKNGSVYLCGLVSKGPAPPDCGKDAGSMAAVADRDALSWIHQHTTLKTLQRKKYFWEVSDLRNQSERASFFGNVITVSLSLVLVTASLI